MAAFRYHVRRFPPEERLEGPELFSRIGPAAAALARYGGVLSAVPNHG